MPDARVIIKAKTSLFKRILSPDRLDAELRRVEAELAQDAELIFASFALHRTGRMGRGIHTVKDAGGLAVVVEARDPVTGFDYVRITRFGHRTYRIVPKRPFAASIVATHGKRSRGHSAALRWVQSDNTVVYRRSSKGFHPTSDWADKAIPEIRVRAERRMGQLAQRVEVAWNS